MRSMSARHARWASPRCGELAAHTTAISPTRAPPSGAPPRARRRAISAAISATMRLISATAIDGVRLVLELHHGAPVVVVAHGRRERRATPRARAAHARDDLVDRQRRARSARARRARSSAAPVGGRETSPLLPPLLASSRTALDRRPAVGALDHVVDRQRRDGGGDQGLHLDAGAVDRLDRRRDADAPARRVGLESTRRRVVCTGWQSGMSSGVRFAARMPRPAPPRGRRPSRRAPAAMASTTSRVVRTRALATARRAVVVLGPHVHHACAAPRRVRSARRTGGHAAGARQLLLVA